MVEQVWRARVKQPAAAQVVLRRRARERPTATEDAADLERVVGLRPRRRMTGRSMCARQAASSKSAPSVRPVA